METLEIDHKNFLELHIANYECVLNGYCSNIDIDILRMYEHIYRKYVNADFVLTLWCNACVFDCIKRLYDWYSNYKLLVIANQLAMQTKALTEISDKYGYTVEVAGKKKKK